MRTHGQAWIGSEDSDEYWAEGAKCSVVVETVDADEVRLSVILEGEMSDVATVFLSRTAADRLARFLAAAAVSDVKVPSA